ncbi:MAG: hypothetical protein ACJAZ9_000071 [Neolewinella sp.]|jgi:hypothetical protein
MSPGKAHFWEFVGQVSEDDGVGLELGADAGAREE